MHEESVGVSILTNGARLEALKACVLSLLANCYYRPLKIAVFNNGSTDKTHEWCLENMRGGYALDWVYDCSETDLGCAQGQNKAAELVRDCKYVLHLESDFEHLPEALSGQDKLWLHRAIEFMEQGECDYLYLRRMVNEKEAAMHWWARWMPQIDREEGPYLRCPDFWWSNNPHLRRNEAIYEAGCLPMDVSHDGPKGTENWSRPELENAHPPNVWIHRWGVFVHELKNHGDLSGLEGCDVADCYGSARCKYGFFKDSGGDMFCQACHREKSFSDLPEHNERYKELW